MGSRRLITTFLLAYVIAHIDKIHAKPNHVHEERREYQYQRSSKVLFPPSADISSASYNRQFDSSNQEIQGMAEKLRTELDSSQTKGVDLYNGGNYLSPADCTARCALIPVVTGKSSQELDNIAKEMTNQIVSELNSGSLNRNQVNQPNWFEHRVAQRLEELNQKHQTQYQQNVYAAANRFRQQNGNYPAPDQFGNEDVQQTQQNVFSADDLRDVQQTISNQQQFQHQGNFYQGQNQQQSTIYTIPQTTRHRVERINHEERHGAQYPTPALPTQPTQTFVSQNQYKEEEKRTTGGSYPVIQGGSTNSRTSSSTFQETQRTVPVVIPTQSVITERENVYSQNRTSYVRPPPVYTSSNTRENEERHRSVVEVYTATPVYVEGNRHSIYNHLRDETEVPILNYRPRVIVDKNHELEINNLHRETVQPTQHQIYTEEEEQYLERLTHLQDDLQRWGLAPFTQTEYNSTIATGKFERHGYQFVYNNRNGHYEQVEQHRETEQPSQQVYVQTEERYEDRLSHLKDDLLRWGFNPFSSESEYKSTIETGKFEKNGYWFVYNQRTGHFEKSERTSSYRPTEPAQTQVITEEHREYQERLLNLQHDLQTWGFGPLTETEYNSTIKNRRFEKNGYLYVYNERNGRFEQAGRTSNSNQHQDHEHNHQHHEHHQTFETNENRQYTTQITEAEYLERLAQLQNELERLGYSSVSEEQYNSTIFRGSFTHDDHEYRYNPQTRCYEQGQRLSTEYEHQQSSHNQEIGYDYQERLNQVRTQLAELGYRSLREEMYNATITSGAFTHNGYKYNYNPVTKRFEHAEHSETEHQTNERLYIQPLPRRRFIEEITNEQYLERVELVRNELARLGYGRYDNDAYNETIQCGGFAHDGYKYVFNQERGRYEKSGRLDVTKEEKYQTSSHQLQQQLQLIGFSQMSEQEINQTLTTGMFVRGGSKYTYNQNTEQYDRLEIGPDEQQRIFERIREILRRFGYRQMSHKENVALLDEGMLIRGGHKWLYNARSGTLEKSEFVGEFAEMTEEEYQAIFARVQETIRNLGYVQMNQRQCNATITSGSFLRGGISWIYNADTQQFERIDLSQTEYRDRLNVLRNEMSQIGVRELSPEEYRSIVYKGYFQHGGYRYEFSSESGHFERVEITAEEYADRLHRLQTQLHEIGYGVMSASDCQLTIYNGVFYFNGYEWLYNYDSGNYVKGRSSDRTQGTGIRENNNGGVNATGIDGRRRVNVTINKDRGDQPPPAYTEEFDEYEMVEEEPGKGFYSVGTRPEVGIAAPGTYNQMAATTPRPPRPTQPTYSNFNELERDRIERERIERQRVYGPVGGQQQYQREYHRTQTSYVQEGAVPIQYATQNRLPPTFLENVGDLITEPSPTYAYATEVYTVGSANDRPRNRQRNDATNHNRRSLDDDRRNKADDKFDKVEDLGQTYVAIDDGQQTQDESQRTEDLTQQTVNVGQGGVGHIDDNLRKRQEEEDLRLLRHNYELQSGNLRGDGHEREDLTQQHVKEDFRQQHVNEDLTQQHVSEDLRQQHVSEDLTQQHVREDLRQQHVSEDLTQQHVREDFRQHHETEDLRQQHQNEDLTQFQQGGGSSNRQSAYSTNSESRVRSEHIQEPTEEIAHVVEVTTQKEQPGLWRRFKDKTKDLFG